MVDETRPYAAGLPFVLVADPCRTLYRRFGVRASAAAVAHPRAWWAALRGLRLAPPRAAGLARPAAPGLPGDFLIGQDGTVVAARRGPDADDQWSVDDLLGLAAGPSSKHGS